MEFELIQAIIHAGSCWRHPHAIKLMAGTLEDLELMIQAYFQQVIVHDIGSLPVFILL